MWHRSPACAVRRKKKYDACAFRRVPSWCCAQFHFFHTQPYVALVQLKKKIMQAFSCLFPLCPEFTALVAFVPRRPRRHFLLKRPLPRSPSSHGAWFPFFQFPLILTFLFLPSDGTSLQPK